MPEGPRIENGIVVGTASNKYEMRNPIARALVAGFDRAVGQLARRADPGTVLEIGAGEGHVTAILLEVTSARITATDISAAVLEEAKGTVRSPRVDFHQADVVEAARRFEPAELVVCCEVLEHLEDPDAGLDALHVLTRGHALLSVPREPLFRGLNMLRGAYLRDFGNSPGHLQHWSTRSFLRFVSRRFRVVEVRRPLPWTVLLAQPRPV